MTKVRRKEFADPACHDTLLKTLHKTYTNIPPAVSTLFWATVGYAAFEGIKHYRNEGFFNEVVLVPIVEEVLFRVVSHGIIEKAQQVYNSIQKTQMDETSTRNRVIAASLLFGLNHAAFAQTFWNLGRGCGYLYEETGSLAPAILLHMYHNYVAESALQPYVRQEFTYPILFYALGKKMFPIPDFITKPISTVASRVTKMLPFALQMKCAD